MAAGLLLLVAASVQAGVPRSSAPDPSSWACAAEAGFERAPVAEPRVEPARSGDGCDAPSPMPDEAQAADIQRALGSSVAPVPEPPAYALMLAGLAVIGLVLHRRRPPRD